MEGMTRAEALQWCKDRAIECQLRAAVMLSSWLSATQKHPMLEDVRATTAILLPVAMSQAICGYWVAMKSWIEGFN